MKDGLEVYDSNAYKIMCVMDICLDIDEDYRTYFKSSEGMFEYTKHLLLTFEEQDNGKGAWYEKLAHWLEKEMTDEDN